MPDGSKLLRVLQSGDGKIEIVRMLGRAKCERQTASAAAVTGAVIRGLKFLRRVPSPVAFIARDGHPRNSGGPRCTAAHRTMAPDDILVE